MTCATRDALPKSKSSFPLVTPALAACMLALLSGCFSGGRGERNPAQDATTVATPEPSPTETMDGVSGTYQMYAPGEEPKAAYSPTPYLPRVVPIDVKEIQQCGPILTELKDEATGKMRPLTESEKMAIAGADFQPRVWKAAAQMKDVSDADRAWFAQAADKWLAPALPFECVDERAKAEAAAEAAGTAKSPDAPRLAEIASMWKQQYFLACMASTCDKAMKAKADNKEFKYVAGAYEWMNSVRDANYDQYVALVWDKDAQDKAKASRGVLSEPNVKGMTFTDAWVYDLPAKGAKIDPEDLAIRMLMDKFEYSRQAATEDLKYFRDQAGKQKKQVLLDVFAKQVVAQEAALETRGFIRDVNGYRTLVVRVPDDRFPTHAEIAAHRSLVEENLALSGEVKIIAPDDVIRKICRVNAAACKKLGGKPSDRRSAQTKRTPREGSGRQTRNGKKPAYLYGVDARNLDVKTYCEERNVKGQCIETVCLDKRDDGTCAKSERRINDKTDNNLSTCDADCKERIKDAVTRNQARTFFASQVVEEGKSKAPPVIVYVQIPTRDRYQAGSDQLGGAGSLLDTLSPRYVTHDCSTFDARDVEIMTYERLGIVRADVIEAGIRPYAWCGSQENCAAGCADARDHNNGLLAVTVDRSVADVAVRWRAWKDDQKAEIHSLDLADQGPGKPKANAKMQFAIPEDLLKKLRNDGPLTEEEVRRLFITAMQATWDDLGVRTLDAYIERNPTFAEMYRNAVRLLTAPDASRHFANEGDEVVRYFDGQYYLIGKYYKPTSGTFYIPEDSQKKLRAGNLKSKAEVDELVIQGLGYRADAAGRKALAERLAADPAFKAAYEDLSRQLRTDAASVLARLKDKDPASGVAKLEYGDYSDQVGIHDPFAVQYDPDTHQAVKDTGWYGQTRKLYEDFRQEKLEAEDGDQRARAFTERGWNWDKGGPSLGFLKWLDSMPTTRAWITNPVMATARGVGDFSSAMINHLPRFAYDMAHIMSTSGMDHGGDIDQGQGYKNWVKRIDEFDDHMNVFPEKVYGTMHLGEKDAYWAAANPYWWVNFAGRMVPEVGMMAATMGLGSGAFMLSTAARSTGEAANILKLLETTSATAGVLEKAAASSKVLESLGIMSSRIEGAETAFEQAMDALRLARRLYPRMSPEAIDALRAARAARVALDYAHADAAALRATSFFDTGKMRLLMGMLANEEQRLAAAKYVATLYAKGGEISGGVVMSVDMAAKAAAGIFDRVVTIGMHQYCEEHKILAEKCKDAFRGTDEARLAQSRGMKAASAAFAVNLFGGMYIFVGGALVTSEAVMISEEMLERNLLRKALDMAPTMATQGAKAAVDFPALTAISAIATSPYTGDGLPEVWQQAYESLKMVLVFEGLNLHMKIKATAKSYAQAREELAHESMERQMDYERTGDFTTVKGYIDGVGHDGVLLFARPRGEIGNRTVDFFTAEQIKQMFVDQNTQLNYAKAAVSRGAAKALRRVVSKAEYDALPEAGKASYKPVEPAYTANEAQARAQFRPDRRSYVTPDKLMKFAQTTEQFGAQGLEPPVTELNYSIDKVVDKSGKSWDLADHGIAFDKDGKRLLFNVIGRDEPFMLVELGKIEPKTAPGIFVPAQERPLDVDSVADAPTNPNQPADVPSADNALVKPSSVDRAATDPLKAIGDKWAAKSDQDVRDVNAQFDGRTATGKRSFAAMSEKLAPPKGKTTASRLTEGERAFVELTLKEAFPADRSLSAGDAEMMKSILDQVASGQSPKPYTLPFLRENAPTLFTPRPEGQSIAEFYRNTPKKYRDVVLQKSEVEFLDSNGSWHKGKIARIDAGRVAKVQVLSGKTETHSLADGGRPWKTTVQSGPDRGKAIAELPAGDPEVAAYRASTRKSLQDAGINPDLPEMRARIENNVKAYRRVMDGPTREQIGVELKKEITQC